MKFCKNCGAKLPPDAAFCTSCGTKQDEQQVQQQEKPQVEVKNKPKEGEQEAAKATAQVKKQSKSQEEVQEKLQDEPKADVKQDKPQDEQQEEVKDKPEVKPKEAGQDGPKAEAEETPQQSSQDPTQSQKQVDAAASTEVKKGKSKGIIITAVIVVIAIVGYLFFTSKFFAFAMIKRDPLGAFSKAAQNQQNLKSYSSNVKLSGDLSGTTEQLQASLNLDSNVNISKNQTASDCSFTLKSGDQTKTVKANLFQDANKIYIKFPVIDKYIKIEPKNDNKSKEYNELAKRISQKAIDTLKSKISNSDLDTSEETIEINNKKCDVVKIHFKLDKEKLAEIWKAALVNIIQDTKFKDYIKSFYQGDDFDYNYNQSVSKIKGTDMNEGLRDINLPKLSLDAYIDKDNNLVGTKIEASIEPKNEQGTLSLSLQQTIGKINDVENVNLPSDLSNNSKDIEYFSNSSYSENLQNYFDFSQFLGY